MRRTVVAVLLLGVAWAGAVDSAAAQDAAAFAELGPFTVAGDGPGVATFGLGAFEAFEDPTPAFQAEYRFGRKLGFAGPVAGLSLNTDGGVVGYAGLYADATLGSFVVTPQFSVGIYDNGEGADLGGGLQFRSAVEFAYGLDGGARIGLRLTHLSNAGLEDENPGAEELYLTYTLRPW